MSNNQPSLKRKRKDVGQEAVTGSVSSTSIQSSIDRRCSSPDMFADRMEQTPGVSAFLEDDPETENLYASVTKVVEESLGKNVRELKDESCSIKECRTSEIKAKHSMWKYQQMPTIRPSENHAVLFQLPLVKGEMPIPFKKSNSDRWDSDHVRMPFSSQNLCSDDQAGGSVRPVWELVEEALLRKIVSSQQLEAAILSYNSKYSRFWDFTTLHHFLSDVLDESEADCFFSTVLPKMVQLALQLPTLIKSPIPLLKQFKNCSVSLSQLQIASLLSNAFFCTFPRRNTVHRNSEYASFPDINFNRLFQSPKKKSSKRGIEKLKCILHYFRRVTHKAPEGVVTFTRRYIHAENLPHWENSAKSLRNLRVTSHGTIECDGKGMLQVDFANKLIGGGVLAWGCVQEEIRFVICPELIVARLFTESFQPLEALHIVGCEQFSNYKGYGDTFEWDGDFHDKTPRDSSGRLMCALTAIDALAFRNPNLQFTVPNLQRELNKAYVGFYSPDVPRDHLSPVATGNWGCGVYRGNPRLKSLLQLMAASEAGRDLVYFTFGNEKLQNEILQIYVHLVDCQITVGKLWKYLMLYNSRCFKEGRVNTELYKFLYNITSNSSRSASSSAGHLENSCNDSTNIQQFEDSITGQQQKIPNPSSSAKSAGKSQINEASANSFYVKSNSEKKDILHSSDMVSEQCFSTYGASIMAGSSEQTGMVVDSSDEEDNKHTNELQISTNASATCCSNKRTSLLEQLDNFDKTENIKTLPSSRRKISDYFSVIQK